MTSTSSSKIRPRPGRRVNRRYVGKLQPGEGFIEPSLVFRGALAGASPTRNPPALRAPFAAADIGVVRAETGHELAAGDGRRALPGRPRAELPLTRPRREVFGRVVLRDTRRRSLDTHLHALCRPVEAERGVRVRRELGGLAALVVGEESEASRVD